MNGQVDFVGAGPGAADLITLRGAKLLAEADTVIYAGSLVNEKLLETASHAELHNSAKLSLPEVLAIIERDYRAGKKIVRLHTGDPALYGAVAEQFRELDRLGIPYRVTPGVSSLFAAAAALKVELTMPDLSQSVIVTRDAGRTPVPEGEELTGLAAHGATLAIFLSVGGMAKLVAKLLAAGRSPATPAAVVYRASWDNELIVRGTLADIAEKVEAAGIKRQAMILVGDVLASGGALSKLYDQTFATGFRHHRFHGKVALFALTRQAALKAAEIAAGLEHDAAVFAPARFADAVPGCRSHLFAAGGFGEALKTAWREFNGLVMVMAAGIVVRHLAELCGDKSCDPAVAVVDERGDYAVSLLSGHLGGGNDLARDVARITNGQAVITTASDVEHLPAFDDFARRFHYRIRPGGDLTAVAAAVVNGDPVELEMPEALFALHFAGYPHLRHVGESSGGTIRVRAGTASIELVKRRYVLGLGCHRGVAPAHLEDTVTRMLGRYGCDLDAIESIASATAKANEAGLLEFAARYGKALRFFPAEELNAVAVPNPSPAPLRHLGTSSVAEAAALLAAGPGSCLVLEKTAAAGVTVALAERSHHE